MQRYTINFIVPYEVSKIRIRMCLKVMEDRSGKGEVNLSVDHPDKILELGDSIDIGKCKETKKDGSGCTNLVSDN